MWLMTPRGFYSAVEKYGDRADGLLTIRARNKADIDNLADLIPNAKPFKEKGYSDYEWRIRCTKQEWALAVARMVMEIDYVNFKDEVKRVQGQARASVYGNLWWSLLELEDPSRKSGSYSNSTLGDSDYAWNGSQWDETTDDKPWDIDKPAPLDKPLKNSRSVSRSKNKRNQRKQTPKSRTRSKPKQQATKRRAPRSQTR